MNNNRTVNGGNGAPVQFHIVDKRHFTDLDSIPAATEEEKPRYPTYVEELMGRLAEAEKRFEERKIQMMDEIARVRARLEADLERRLAIEKQKVVLPFLEVLDNLERAINAANQAGEAESLLAGIEMTTGLFRAELQALGVEPLDVMNQPFDPNVGQAIGTVPVDDPNKDGLVLDEVERGYRIGDQLLRPAQVRVGQLRQLTTSD